MSEFPVTTRVNVEGVSETMAGLGQVWQSFREGETTAAQFNESMKSMSEGIYAQRRAMMLIRTEYKVSHATLMEFNRAMMNVAHIGQSMISIWQAYETAQLRVERLNRDLSDSTLDVAAAETLYNRYLKDFGADSAYTIDALDRLNDAKAREKDLLDQVAKAQNENMLGNVGIGLSAMGIVAQLFYLQMNLATTAATLHTTTGALITSKFAWLGEAAAIAGTGPALLLAAAGITMAIMMWQGYTQKLKEATEAQEYLNKISVTPAAPYGRVAGVYQGLREGWAPIAGAGQFGIRYVERTGYYHLEKGERVSMASEARAGVGMGRGGLVVSRLQFNQHFSGPISSDVDLERSGDLAYRAFMRKLENKTR